MLRTYLIVLFVAALGALAAYWLRSDSGYVLISYRGYLIETSLLGFAAATAFGLAALYYGLRLLVAGLRLPSMLRRAARDRRAEYAQQSFEAGLLKLLEGNWRRAEIELVRRAADHHAQHLNYLGAARAAQRLGAGERRDHYLRLAARSAPDMEFAALLTQAELQRERGEHELARETALKLRERDANHPYAVELLAESCAATGRWSELLKLLVETDKNPALTAARQRELLLAALSGLLRAAVESADLARLKAAWDSVPARIHEEPEAQRLYARGLARLNANAEALALISGALARRWDADLAALYGELHSEDAIGQLATIEQWLHQHGERPELLVTAGRACLRNRLWGKARSYLEAVTRAAPSAAAYLELARLCEQTQNAAEAQKFYRVGLELAASAAGQVSKA